MTFKEIEFLCEKDGCPNLAQLKIVIDDGIDCATRYACRDHIAEMEAEWANEPGSLEVKEF